MKESGRLLSLVHKEVEKAIKPGVSTGELDKLAYDMIKGFGCTPNFLNYGGFPGTLCTSINNTVVHGFPSYDAVLKEGDIVSIDAGLIYKGYHSDAARTHAVGKISKEAQDLIRRTEQSFFEGIKFAKAGNHLFDISNAIDDYISQFGYGIVKDMCGHGVGTALHEDPEIPNYRQHRKGALLKPGMTLAIEPMINLGGWEVDIDEWKCVTSDGSISAHYENTVLITEGEPVLLTGDARTESF
jgi:methionyl aminopeptidase